MIDPRDVTEEEAERLCALQEIPKEYWGDGRWQDEPDTLEFEAHGYKCHLKRSMHFSGCWLGYVDIPLSNPCADVSLYEDRKLNLDVHGGVTYSAPEGDMWRIGFDCAHGFDYMPLAPVRGILLKRIDAYSEMGQAMLNLSNIRASFFPEVTYKTIWFAQDEATKLAQLLREVEDNHSLVQKRDEGKEG